MVQVDYLVLADAAAAVEGKHYIHGAGWDTLLASAFPTTHPMLSAALRLRIPWGDTNRPHLIELDIVDADGQSVLPDPPGALRGPFTVGRPAHVAPGSDQVVPLVFNFNGIQFQRPGSYVVVVRVEGIDMARSPFEVRALHRSTFSTPPVQ